MRCCALFGLALTLAACRGPSPQQPAPEATAPADTPSLDVPAVPLLDVPAASPPDRFATFFSTFCTADADSQASMLAPNFIGQSLLVPGGTDPKTAHEASGLIAVDVGDRMIVPTFPMCEDEADSSYDIAEDGRGSATIGGHRYRVAFTLEPLQLTHLLLELPPDPTAGQPAPPKTDDVLISTMQVPSAPVSSGLQRRLERYLQPQRGCIDAYVQRTDSPVGAAVDLVVPANNDKPYLSARTVADLGVLACFEARLGEVDWNAETEARLILHYGVLVEATGDAPTVEMIRAD